MYLDYGGGPMIPLIEAEEHVQDQHLIGDLLINIMKAIIQCF